MDRSRNLSSIPADDTNMTLAENLETDCAVSRATSSQDTSVESLEAPLTETYSDISFDEVSDVQPIQHVRRYFNPRGGYTSPDGQSSKTGSRKKLHFDDMLSEADRIAVYNTHLELNQPPPSKVTKFDNLFGSLTNGSSSNSSDTCHSTAHESEEPSCK
jgi:hypothetical protein